MHCLVFGKVWFCWQSHKISYIAITTIHENAAQNWMNDVELHLLYPYMLSVATDLQLCYCTELPCRLSITLYFMLQNAFFLGLSSEISNTPQIFVTRAKILSHTWIRRCLAFWLNMKLSYWTGSFVWRIVHRYILILTRTIKHKFLVKFSPA